MAHCGQNIKKWKFFDKQKLCGRERVIEYDVVVMTAGFQEGNPRSIRMGSQILRLLIVSLCLESMET